MESAAKTQYGLEVLSLIGLCPGTLLPEFDGLDLLRASFPGGSITGAPKIRAMEIIADLEPCVRGVYCGAIGYLSATGELDTNIAIRTAVCRDGIAHFNVGAGIVADSDPAAEYEETLAKAAGFLAALEICKSRREEVHFKIENRKLV